MNSSNTCKDIRLSLDSKTTQISFGLQDDSRIINENSIYNRSTRSHSHALFNIKPDMIPRPKPKLSYVCPSPLKLNKKYDYGNESDTCFSSQESDGDSSFSVENNDSLSEPLTIVDFRKGVIKNCQLTKDTPNEYESKLLSPLQTKTKKKTLFSKTIKELFKEGTANIKDKRKTVVSRPRFTILNVLEKAYESTFDLVQCKSNIV